MILKKLLTGWMLKKMTNREALNNLYNQVPKTKNEILYKSTLDYLERLESAYHALFEKYRELDIKVSKYENIR